MFTLSCFFFLYNIYWNILKQLFSWTPMNLYQRAPTRRSLSCPLCKISVIECLSNRRHATGPRSSCARRGGGGVPCLCLRVIQVQRNVQRNVNINISILHHYPALKHIGCINYLFEEFSVSWFVIKIDFQKFISLILYLMLQS